MGDFNIIDEFTQNLLDTLERLDLYENQGGVFTEEALFKASQTALQGFGKPMEMFLDPTAIGAFKKLNGKK